MECFVFAQRTWFEKASEILGVKGKQLSLEFLPDIIPLEETTAPKGGRFLAC